MSACLVRHYVFCSFNLLRCFALAFCLSLELFIFVGDDDYSQCGVVVVDVATGAIGATGDDIGESILGLVLITSRCGHFVQTSILRELWQCSGLQKWLHIDNLVRYQNHLPKLNKN